MSNTAQQIFELLNTMNPTEKSYVKKTFNTNEKNMSQLFNDLNKCDQFDKKAFLTRFKNRSYIKYLPQNCKYLLKRIIKSLIDYNIENLPDIKIMSRLSTIILLVKKGLFSACLRKIDKEIEFAENYQYFEYGYQLIKLKERFYKIYLIKKISYEEYVELAEKKKFFIEQLQLIDELDLLCTVLCNETFSIKQKIEIADAKFKQHNFLCLSTLPDEMPLMVKLNFNSIKYTLSRLKGKPELKYLKQSLIDYDKSPFLKDIYFETYLLCIYNFFTGLLIDEKFDSFFEAYKKYMNELVGFPKWNTMQTSPLYYLIKHFTFILASVLSNQSGKAIEEANECQQIINEKIDKLPVNFSTYTLKLNSSVFFNNGHINETLDTIELLQKDKNIKTQYFYKVMQILCHYKLGNLMLVDSLSNSLATCLRKNNKTAMLKDFLKLKKCLLQEDCKKLDQLKYLPYLDLNTLKTNTFYINTPLKKVS